MRRLILLALILLATLLPGWSLAGYCSPLTCSPSQVMFAHSSLLGVRSAPESLLRVLDLRTGRTAWRLPGTRLVTVEAQEISVKLARKSIAYNGLENRYEIRQGDFRNPGVLRDDEKFDLILGSPPYFPAGTGVPRE